MILGVCFAFGVGLLLSLNRQVNGRLSLATSPLVASFCNFLIGAALLTTVGIITGILTWPAVGHAPLWTYLGGPLGVLSVAAAAWLTPRAGATTTTLLLIAGQVCTGIALDVISGRTPVFWATALGIVMVAAGVWLQSTARAARD